MIDGRFWTVYDDEDHLKKLYEEKNPAALALIENAREWLFASCYKKFWFFDVMHFLEHVLAKMRNFVNPSLTTAHMALKDPEVRLVR